ncbi:Cytochrome oxidase assembly [Croceitalea dokdonensis DOKDO 023]|uniref:Cytochrome oxidase assembly n=1 Tax=Croceitalea dokdonensis DOKDO 023 TaxID=1300341 RepID=A0A0P7B102_9FLAO|nr:COX15/CtaA family protein [Croceitalea dokdonensis]KPM31619.1 Cytochrome oxidase assembly [Croceitalea dokdonensis DOKDO 023]
MKKNTRKVAKIALVLVYLVIIAGAVVRMTGSGMGCPDWPKCFGYYIPPTEESTLLWEPNKTFEKGQVIIVKESLLVAKTNLTTGATINTENWETYTKHDYAKFNVWHTWIEYINRLLGALAGLATLILALFSLSYWKEKKRVTLLSFLVVLGMGFQAWLGATVVYSVLAPVRITLHMLMALVIVAMLIYLIFLLADTKKRLLLPKKLQWLLGGALILTLIQVALGTQVRQFVDEQIDLVGEGAKQLWLKVPALNFYVHRSLSILVLAINGYLFYSIKRLQLPLVKINWVMLVLVLEILTGIAMYYLDFPFGSQPLHLVLASLLFGVQFYLLLEAIIWGKPNKSL